MRSRVRARLPLPMILAVPTWAACAPPASTPEASTMPALRPTVAAGSATVSAMPVSPMPATSQAPTVATRARAGVLAREDLPPGCGLTSERDDRWDVISYQWYVGGWTAFYACPATPSRTINLIADATACTNADLARKAVAEAKTYVEAHDWATEIPLDETIGDAAVALRHTTHPFFSDDSGHTVVFNAADMSYFLWAEGPPGMVDLAMVVGLAKKQLARSLTTPP